MIITLNEAAERYGVARKSIRQAARRHAEVKAAIIEHVEGAEGAHLDTDKFDIWWNEYRDKHMDDVRRGRGGS